MGGFVDSKFELPLWPRSPCGALGHRPAADPKLASSQSGQTFRDVKSRPSKEWMMLRHRGITLFVFREALRTEREQVVEASRLGA